MEYFRILDLMLGMRKRQSEGVARLQLERSSDDDLHEYALFRIDRFATSLIILDDDSQ